MATQGSCVCTIHGYTEDVLPVQKGKYFRCRMCIKTYAKNRRDMPEIKHRIKNYARKHAAKKASKKLQFKMKPWDKHFKLEPSPTTENMVRFRKPVYIHSMVVSQDCVIEEP